MKRHADLWPHVVSLENLHAAAYRVLRGKRRQVQAGEFFRDLEGNLLRLQRELEIGAYRPGAYRTFWISEPKRRMISAAPFRDRVVHHALVRVIEPLFERRFIHHSYACRRGKGTHRALRQFVRWARATRYTLKLDVRKFFPSIDHEVLKEQLRRVIRDRDVLRLGGTIIDGSCPQETVVQHFPGDDLLTPSIRRRGIPIGNLTSQFLANVLLNDLDHQVKERLRVRRYLRYVDDFCCFGDDRARLDELRDAIREHLLGLRLRLNERKSRVRQLREGIEFLGFVVLTDRIRLNSRAVRRQRRRLRSMRGGLERGELSLSDVTASVQAWCAHAAHGDTWRLRSEVWCSLRG